MSIPGERPAKFIVSMVLFDLRLEGVAIESGYAAPRREGLGTIIVYDR